MLNIRVFALVALATFGVAAVLRAFCPSWLARSAAHRALPSQTAIRQAVISQTVISQTVISQTVTGPGVIDPAAIAPASFARTAPATTLPGTTAPATTLRSGGRRARSHAVLVRAAAPASGGLHAEQRQLEVVQKALEKGRGAAAARALAEYGAVFPSGELGLEAELLRIDVALVRGERDRALELARAFASRPEAARYRDRLVTALGSAPSAAATSSGEPR